MVTTTAKKENGEFCIAVAPATGLLVYCLGAGCQIEPAIRPGQSGSYTVLTGFNPRRLKWPKRGWAFTQRTSVSMQNLLHTVCAHVSKTFGDAWAPPFRMGAWL